MTSILLSVKKLLGLPEDYTQFDTDIIIHINTAFSILTQLGVGPEDGFSISDASTEWSEYFSDSKELEMVRTYVYLKVRLVFDPPQNSFVTTSIEKTISELEWRLNVASDTGKEGNK